MKICKLIMQHQETGFDQYNNPVFFRIYSMAKNRQALFLHKNARLYYFGGYKKGKTRFSCP